MKKSNRIIYLSILIIISILFLQLIPPYCVSSDTVPQSGTYFKILLSRDIISSGVLNISREARKMSSVYKVSVQNTFAASFQEDIRHEALCFMIDKPFDYRSHIKQNIDHYFNGGKYKEYTLLS